MDDYDPTLDAPIIDYVRAATMAKLLCPKCGYGDPASAFTPRYAKHTAFDPAERLYWSCRTCGYEYVSRIASED